MTIWTCPRCDRRFGAVGTGHVCEPGITLDAYARGALPAFRPIFDAIHDRLRGLDGDLIVDPLASCVLLKHGPTFCIVDSKTRWVAVGVTLRRRLDSPRLSRKVSEQGGRFHHTFNLTDPAEVDDELLGWIEEAFHVAVGRTPPGGGDDDGGMVPDDVDVDLA